MLPVREKVDIPIGDHVEDVDLVNFEDTRGSDGRRGEAYDEDDDEDHHGPRVQCAHQ